MFAEFALSMSLTDFGTSSDWSPGAFVPIVFGVRFQPWVSMPDADDDNDDDVLLLAILAEFERLGLDIGDFPDFAIGDAPAVREQLRDLAPGVTRQDVLPEFH